MTTSAPELRTRILGCLDNIDSFVQEHPSMNTHTDRESYAEYDRLVGSLSLAITEWRSALHLERLDRQKIEGQHGQN